MAYEKQNWKTGDVVTSAKLNHLEDGVAAGGGGLVATLSGETGALDKTFSEIKTALLSGAQIWIATPASSGAIYFPVVQIDAKSADGGTIKFDVEGTSVTLTAATDSDYPSAGDPPK